MLTEKQLEIAAREYCKQLGLDPDARQSGAGSEHPTLAVIKPAWQWFVPHIKSAYAMQKALGTISEH